MFFLLGRNQKIDRLLWLYFVSLVNPGVQDFLFSIRAQATVEMIIGDIIEFLSQNKGIIFDRETIYEKVWGLDGSGDNSVITEHIRRIRTKFLSKGDNPYIETVWGCGYKWKK